MQAGSEVAKLPTKVVEARAHFDAFVGEEHDRLFKALYFVTGSREGAEDLAQDAFLELWARWDEIDRIAYWGFHPERVYMIDVRTERSEFVAHGA